MSGQPPLSQLSGNVDDENNYDLYQSDGNVHWNLSQYFIDDDNDKVNLHQGDGNVDWNRNQGQVGGADC